MAKCKKCGKFILFKPLNDEGLCTTCAEGKKMDDKAEQHRAPKKTLPVDNSRCKRCGKIACFEILNDDGFCATCVEKMRREEEESRKAKKEKELQDAKALLAETVTSYNSLPTLSDFLEEGDLSKADTYISAYYDFHDKLYRLSQYKNIPEAQKKLYFDEAFGNREEAKNFLAYVSTVMKRITGMIDCIAECKKRTAAFESCLNMLELVPVKLSTCQFQPDENPDYANFKSGTITKTTNYENICDFITVDVKTTGLSHLKNEIIQISAVRFSRFEPVDAFSTYIKPKNGITPDVLEINGITPDVVENAPYIEDVVNSFREYIGTSLPLVGHNLLFDLKFLCSSGCVTLKAKRKYFDTLQLSRNIDDIPEYTLEYFARYVFSILRKNSHDSLSDSLLTGYLFKMIFLNQDGLSSRVMNTYLEEKKHAQKKGSGEPQPMKELIEKVFINRTNVLKLAMQLLESGDSESIKKLYLLLSEIDVTLGQQGYNLNYMTALEEVNRYYELYKTGAISEDTYNSLVGCSARLK